MVRASSDAWIETVRRTRKRETREPPSSPARSALGADAVRVKWPNDLVVDDASGDSLDAVLCLLQAAWACRQGTPWYGLPQDMDGLEGWIITA